MEKASIMNLHVRNPKKNPYFRYKLYFFHNNPDIFPFWKENLMCFLHTDKLVADGIIKM